MNSIRKLCETSTHSSLNSSSFSSSVLSVLIIYNLSFRQIKKHRTGLNFWLCFFYVQDEQYVTGTRMRVKDDAGLRKSIIKNNR